MKSMEALEKAAAAAAAAIGEEGEARGAWGPKEQARALARGAGRALELAAARGESPSFLWSLDRFLAQRRPDQTSITSAA